MNDILFLFGIMSFFIDGQQRNTFSNDDYSLRIIYNNDLHDINYFKISTKFTKIKKFSSLNTLHGFHS